MAAQFLYPLDKPKSFERDAIAGDVERSDIKVSENVLLHASLEGIVRQSARWQPTQRQIIL